MRLTSPYAGATDPVIGAIDFDRAELFETPVENFLCFQAALVERPGAGDDKDKPAAIADRRADQAIARVLRVAGLHAIGAWIVDQQGVAILLADLVPGEFALAVIFVVFGISLDDVLRQYRELAHRDQMLRVRQSGGVSERGLGQTELAGSPGHEVGEGFFRSRHAFCNRDAGIVG